MLVEVQDAVFGYAQRPVVRVALLRLSPGGCLGIFGPNGVGKTTLVRGLSGLLPAMSGRVTRTAQRFGYLPQHRALDLHWPMTALDAASMAISARKRFGWIGRDHRSVCQAMRIMEVDDLSNRAFARLSGGQQQRVLLAGALASDPQILILDEPTDGLDVRSRQSLIEALRTQNERGLCTVLISHEVEDLLMLASEIAWLHPPDDPSQASIVEMIAPDALADRVVRSRWRV